MNLFPRKKNYAHGCFKKIKIIQVDNLAQEKQIYNLYYEALSLDSSPFALSPDEISTFNDFRQFTSRDGYWCLAFLDQEPIGCVKIILRRPVKLRHKAELACLFVRPDYRREGVASKLIKSAISYAPEYVEFIRLFVNDKMFNTINLYKNEGFQSYAVEKNAKFYQGLYLDELMMEKWIEKL